MNTLREPEDPNALNFQLWELELTQIPQSRRELNEAELQGLAELAVWGELVQFHPDFNDKH